MYLTNSTGVTWDFSNTESDPPQNSWIKIHVLIPSQTTHEHVKGWVRLQTSSASSFHGYRWQKHFNNCGEIGLGQFAAENKRIPRDIMLCAFGKSLQRRGKEKQGRQWSFTEVADSATILARTRLGRETCEVGVMRAPGKENSCLFQKQLPLLSLPHRNVGPVLSDLLTFSEAQNIHFNGKILWFLFSEAQKTKSNSVS